MDSNQANESLHKRVKVSVKEFKAKYGDKVELERLLRLECGLFLPDHRHCTNYHYRDIVYGKKKVSHIGYP